MKRHFTPLLCLLILAALMAACQSTKRSASTVAEESQGIALVKQNIGSRLPSGCFSSKIHLELTVKGEKTTANGSLKIRQGQWIQLSITPLLGIEIARVEITPDTLLVIDRFNKQYAKASLEDLKLIGNTGNTFPALENLLLNKLFLPGESKGISPSGIRQLSFRKEEGGGIIATLKKRNSSQASRSFQFNAQRELAMTRISAPQKYELAWEYSDFTTTANGRYPATMKATLQSNLATIQAKISHSKISTKKFDAKQSAVPKRYKPLDIESLIKTISDL